MICPSCGHTLNTEDTFCPHCKNKICFDSIDTEKTLLMHKIVEKEIPSESSSSIIKGEIFPKDLDNKNNNFIKNENSPGKNTSIFLFPIISALAACSIVILTYGYEYYINEKILSMQKQGEALAISGDINKSFPIIEEASKKRPNYEALKIDLDFLDKGKNIETTLKKVDKLKEDNKFNEAINILDSLEKSLYNSTGPFFSSLKNKILNKKNALMLIDAKNDIKNRKTVLELIPLYNKVAAIGGEEGKKLLQELKKQISTIAYNDANEYLKKKNFKSAIDEITRALQYDKNNSKLVSLASTIKEQKNKFELEEQKRLEQAIASAVEEENKNQTQSVKVLSNDLSINENGDLVIEGEIENIGTKPIYSIEIFYNIYNAKGDIIISNSTFVYPNYLYPKDKGKFEYTHYGVKKGSKIKILKSTWFVD
ncbi:hypothetical protein BD780_001374 [Clostridium tetanomorphum]|uniref:Zinc ribbon domain-containing protein n=1 Tax=Clostridium tetanomorphum TaxID=1553 RepID=A0A923J1V8_CLOTT|nr:FxLYD domain-containing protein [Clostridium tetanomorphum]KAJ49557.1 hypothetical protein CTM_22501 [Clostridium tetanomorphum DSM 665]KAJ53906.1 hypothetical protein CTM_00040 [Clostridium tetanomorphum DSM 665]MBC2398110.1 zinc ribbon domain-containing protein [Clostridium tetanomorphum]MBP1864679.1 hypothetical protein [Clostridium tetanomorphum]NRS84149.1 hypothetical protein [Clostridium tetanomorphum]